MPCHSEYMEPTAQERYNQNTAKLLVAFAKFLNKIPDGNIYADSGNMYCKNDCTDKLCNLIQANKSKYNCFIGSDHDLAADLHVWWARHQKVDEKRIAKEQELAKMRELANQAMQKLTKEELEALLNYVRPNQ